MTRQGHRETPAWPGHRFALFLATMVAILTIFGFAASLRVAALPDHASGKVLAVFEPALEDDDVFAALIRAGGHPVRRTWLPFVWVVAGNGRGFVGRLREQGAIGAYGELPFSPQLAGCFAFVDAKAVELFQLRP